MKEKRERADYHPMYHRIEEEVPETIVDAQNCSMRLSQLPPRHPKPQSVRR
jgi:hypothetical protein